MVTTGVDAGNGATPGALGQSGTRILYGGRDFDFGLFNGLRFRAGAWLDADETLGLEASYLGLERRSVGFASSSDGTGSPILARPLTNAATGNATALLTAFPGDLAGGVRIEATTRFWGWEANATIRPSGSGSFHWLAGFRALDLSESLNITETFSPLSPSQVFLGQTFGPPSKLADFDGFHTSNHFYGPQIGGNYVWSFGPWALEARVAVAVGWTSQRVSVEGSTSLVSEPGANPQLVRGGVLAQSTNIGDFERTRFGLVPEIGINLTRSLTDNIRLQLGYTFIYWNSVARPGAQVDSVVRDSLIPTSPFYGNGGGPDRPAPQFRESSFWAQGINLGIVVDF